MEQVISQNRFAEGWRLKISNMDVTSSQSISAHSRFFLVQLHHDTFPFLFGAATDTDRYQSGCWYEQPGGRKRLFVNALNGLRWSKAPPLSTSQNFSLLNRKEGTQGVTFQFTVGEKRSKTTPLSSADLLSAYRSSVCLSIQRFPKKLLHCF